MRKQGQKDGEIPYKDPVIPGWNPHGSKSPGLGGSVRKAGTQGGGGATGDGASGKVGLGGVNYSDGLDNDDTIGRPDRD